MGADLYRAPRRSLPTIAIPPALRAGGSRVLIVANAAGYDPRHLNLQTSAI